MAELRALADRFAEAETRDKSEIRGFLQVRTRLTWDERGGHVTVSTSLAELKHQRNHIVDSMSQYGAATMPCSVGK